MARKKSLTADESASIAPGPRLIGLDEVLGQPRAVDVLERAMSAGRVHHAWIFHGPPGVGKFTTALAFAAALLDPTLGPGLAGRLAPDPESPTRRRIVEGLHPDLHIVTKELAAVSRSSEVRGRKQLTIPKAVIEEFLIEPALRTRSVNVPSLAGKVFLVDEAELLDAGTQNSLLKVMEEPAPGSVIVLITSKEDRLLPTIRSRCQRVAFAPLDEGAMEAWLGRCGLAVDAEERRWLIESAGGSPGAAVAAVENGVYEWRRAIAPMLAALDEGRYPAELGAAMVRFADERAAEWVKRNRDASKDAANKAWASRVLGFLAEHQRESLRRAAAAGTMAPERLEAKAESIDLIAQAERQAQGNVLFAFVLDNLIAQIAARNA